MSGARGNRGRSACALRAVALLLASLWSATGSAATAPSQTPPERAELVLRFRAAAVDGVDELWVQAGAASVRHLEWRPMEGVEIEVLSDPARWAGRRFRVRSKEGRPEVRVQRVPGPIAAGSAGPAEGDAGAAASALCLRIDDGPAPGAAPLSFEVWAEPAGFTGPTGSAGPNVLLITLDSTRPDHLSCYGYARVTSPHLDAFARGALRFDQAFSTSSFTPPSHASIFTSQQVGDHGLLTWNRLDEAAVTLAEVLADHGWRTGASVNLSLLSENGLGQGFEWRREGARDARTIVSEALQFLRADDDRPWFLWLHLYDVHRPYGRAPGWSERFAAAPSNARDGRVVGNGEDDYNLRPADVRARGLDEAALGWIEDRYDAGIAYVDAELGPLLGALEAPATKARTLVVVTADHGEALREHPSRFFSHDPFLTAPVARVPLLLRFPDGRGAGSVRDDMVSLIDVAPTVLAVAGVAAPSAFRGLALLERTPPDRVVFAECWGWERLAAARDARTCALVDLQRDELVHFDRLGDPLERSALAAAPQGRARGLLQSLATFVARPTGKAQEPSIDPDLARRLRELGYGEH